MPYVVARGNTLLVPSGTKADPDKMHLFVVVTDECDAGEHLMVSLSSIKQGVYHDPTCEMQVGAHPFVTAPSYVEYRLAIIRSAQYICQCTNNGAYIPRQPLSAALLVRVADGVLVSSFVPAKIRRYYMVNQP